MASPGTRSRAAVEQVFTVASGLDTDSTTRSRIPIVNSEGREHQFAGAAVRTSECVRMPITVTSRVSRLHMSSTDHSPFLVVVALHQPKEIAGRSCVQRIGAVGPPWTDTTRERTMSGRLHLGADQCRDEEITQEAGERSGPHLMRRWCVTVVGLGIRIGGPRRSGRDGGQRHRRIRRVGMSEPGVSTLSGGSLPRGSAVKRT